MAAREKKQRLAIRIDARDKTAFVREAEKDGRSLSGWVIHTCKLKVRPSGQGSGHSK